ARRSGLSGACAGPDRGLPYRLRRLSPTAASLAAASAISGERPWSMNSPHPYYAAVRQRSGMTGFFATGPVAPARGGGRARAEGGGAGSAAVGRGQCMATGADDRLEELSTWWSVLFAAHDGSAEEARSAQERLLARYGPAVRRYLLAAVHDPHAADDLFGE